MEYRRAEHERTRGQIKDRQEKSNREIAEDFHRDPANKPGLNRRQKDWLGFRYPYNYPQFVRKRKDGTVPPVDPIGPTIVHPVWRDDALNYGSRFGGGFQGSSGFENPLKIVYDWKMNQTDPMPELPKPAEDEVRLSTVLLFYKQQDLKANYFIF